MFRNSLQLAIAGTLAMTAGMVGTAQAATKTASFNVTATVANNCVISANPLALGAFDGTNDLAATSTVVVRCTNGTAYNVELSRGASSSFAARTMSNGTDQLVYNLFTDTTYTNIWGDGSTGTVRVSGTGTGFAANRNITVAGRLQASANTGPVGSGNYTDTIVASIVY
ncbi:MAG: spore coat U domain-containing protein [Proteobacteria bacterium]|jgi:spore coat protein U-like protein|nr:spore coat U domain-containing protein [Pseudomonadota bacterium]